jgi:hypothetical protein
MLRGAAARAAAPKRAAFVMVPNGIVHDARKPATREAPACGAPVRQFGNSSGPIDAIRA